MSSFRFKLTLRTLLLFQWLCFLGLWAAVETWPYLKAWMTTKPIRESEPVILALEDGLPMSLGRCYLCPSRAWAGRLDGLGKLGLWLLGQYLESPVAGIRRNALFVASGMKTLDAEAMTRIYGLYREDPDVGVRALAAFALVGQGKARSAGVLNFFFDSETYDFSNYLKEAMVP